MASRRRPSQPASPIVDGAQHRRSRTFRRRGQARRRRASPDAGRPRARALAPVPGGAGCGPHRRRHLWRDLRRRARRPGRLGRQQRRRARRAHSADARQPDGHRQRHEDLRGRHDPRARRRGRLSLDDSARRFLPELRQVSREITIRQLLDHTSGLADVFNDATRRGLEEHPERAWSTRQVLATLHAPWYQPGEGWAYANTNYYLLGMIVERITGSTLEEELERRFLDPLDLASTRIPEPDDPSSPLAAGLGHDLLGIRRDDLVGRRPGALGRRAVRR